MVYDSLLNKISLYERIAILGVSFKPNSPVTIGSPSVKLIQSLDGQGKTIYCHDFIEETFDNLKFFQRFEVTTCTNAQECINNSDVVVLMHPDKKYKEFDYLNVDVIDYWGVL